MVYNFLSIFHNDALNFVAIAVLFYSYLFCSSCSFFPDLIDTNWRHAGCAQMTRVSVVLIISHLIILTIRAFVLLPVFSGEPALNSLVHRRTLQPLFRHLALIVKTLIH